MSHAADHFFEHQDPGSPPPPSESGIPFAHEAAPGRHAAPLAAPNHEVPDVEAILIEAIEMVETARPAPLSTAIKIEGEPLLDLLYGARERLPEELRAARWLLRDREEHLESQRIEGEEILALARSRAERLVERTEVVRSAEQRAQRILAEAKAEARQMRRETEDFCDARLASLEGILDRTRSVVATGRARLQGADQLDLTDAAQREAAQREAAQREAAEAQHVVEPAHAAAVEPQWQAPAAPAHVQPTVDLFDQDLS